MMNYQVDPKMGERQRKFRKGYIQEKIFEQRQMDLKEPYWKVDGWTIAYQEGYEAGYQECINDLGFKLVDLEIERNVKRRKSDGIHTC